MIELDRVTLRSGEAPRPAPRKEDYVYYVKQAARKLAEMGYANEHEFGGINGWTGDIEK